MAGQKSTYQRLNEPQRLLSKTLNKGIKGMEVVWNNYKKND